MLELQYDCVVSFSMVLPLDKFIKVINVINVPQVSVGVPKARRGEVWSLLADRAGLSGLEERFPALASDYDGLKSQLTSHQHDILIDLGNFTEVLYNFFFKTSS